VRVFDFGTMKGGVMNRTRKLAFGLGVAALVAGGAAVAAPALAQDGTEPPPRVECPYECAYDGDGLMHQYRHGPDGPQDQSRQRDQSRQQDQTGQQDQLRQRDRDGTCMLDNEDSES
jgi:hypothetical protein